MQGLGAPPYGVASKIP